jgi:superfamily II DNA/RNA helicase
VQDIEVVINYDFPAGFQGVEDYVHRIGRTARGTADGKVCARFLRRLCVLFYICYTSCRKVAFASHSRLRQAITFFTSGDSKRATQVYPQPSCPYRHLRMFLTIPSVDWSSQACRPSCP